MRMARLKAQEGEVGYYHCLSRVVDRRFVLGEVEKEHFVKLLRVYEEFCGVEVVTFCMMSNHFHLLVRVPARPPPGKLPSDEDLVARVGRLGSASGAGTLRQDLRRLRERREG